MKINTNSSLNAIHCLNPFNYYDCTFHRISLETARVYIYIYIYIYI